MKRDLGINNNIPPEIVRRLNYFNDKLKKIDLDALNIYEIDNIDYIIYTILHIKAIKQLEKQWGVYEYSITKTHDLDKIALYVIVDKATTKIMHRSLAKHHSDINDSTKLKIEKCLDWESGHMTKIGRDLSAYEFLVQRKTSQYNDLIGTMQKLGITETKCKAITKSEYAMLYREVTVDEIRNYIKAGCQYIDNICKELANKE